MIGKPYYFQLIPFQSICSDFIVFFSFLRKMRCPVNFNHQSGRRAVEISNKSVDDSLTVYLDRVSTQKIKPEMLFLLGHIFAKKARVFF